MKTYRLPHTDRTVSSVALGLMRIAKMADAEIATLFGSARDAGIDVFDHADIYGGERHLSEKRFGDAVTLSAAAREDIVIQSKTGIRPGFFDFSEEHILRSVEGSLKALRTDYLDLLLLHRPDALVEPEEVASAFDKLLAAGKVRQFGVSNHTPGQIELLKSAVNQPLLVNQVQFSPVHAALVAQGIAANIAGLDQSVSRDNGLLDYARLNNVMLQAWSPFQAPGRKGVFLGDRENFAALNDVIDELAAQYGVTPIGIVVAWIVRHPANIQVVLGTTNAGRVIEAADGAAVTLTRQDWYRVLLAGGNRLP